MKIELTYCCGCLNKKLCACLSEKLPYFCKNCLLFSVNEIRKIEKRDCPVGLLCCFKCGRNLEESKFEFKKNSLNWKLGVWIAAWLRVWDWKKLLDVRSVVGLLLMVVLGVESVKDW